MTFDRTFRFKGHNAQPEAVLVRDFRSASNTTLVILQDEAIVTVLLIAFNANPVDTLKARFSFADRHTETKLSEFLTAEPITSSGSQIFVIGQDCTKGFRATGTAVPMVPGPGDVIDVDISRIPLEGVTGFVPLLVGTFVMEIEHATAAPMDYAVLMEFKEVD